MKRLIVFILALAMAFSVASCKSKTQSVEKEEKTIVDNGGNKVVLPEKIEKIAVCGIYPLPSVLTVFFDSADKLVGIPEMSMKAAQNSILSELYPEILNAKTDYENNGTVNTEELIKLNPDIVFYSDSDKETGTALKNAGFCAVAISVNKWEYNSIETLNQWIKLLSEIFPENNKSDIVKKKSDETYKLIQSRTKGLTDEQKAKVFFLFNYTDTNIVTSGKNFFGQWWADAIGAVNVAQELKKDNSVPVNMEQVYKWNPQVVLITNFTAANPNDLYKNTFGSYDWSGIDAVKNKRVYKMPLGMYRSYTPGVDTPVTLLWLAKTVYPDLFDDINITDEVKSYYKEVFNVELTNKQAESIFKPSAEAGKGF